MIKDLFAVQIFHEERFLSLEHCQNVYNFLIQKETYPHRLISNNSVTSFKEYETIALPENIDFFKVLQTRISYFCNQIGIEDCTIRDSWFNLQSENSFLELHAHPICMLTGVVYINVDEKSSPLCLMNPNYTLSFYDRRYENESKFYHRIQPNCGDLVIFPSYLIHGSLHHLNQTKDRMVISFNAVDKNG